MMLMQQLAVPELNFTSYFLRKVSRIVGKSFLEVSLFVFNQFQPYK